MIETAGKKEDYGGDIRTELDNDPVLALCHYARGLCQTAISLQNIFEFDEKFVADPVERTMRQVELVERLRRKGKK